MEETSPTHTRKAFDFSIESLLKKEPIYNSDKFVSSSSNASSEADLSQGNFVEVSNHEQYLQDEQEAESISPSPPVPVQNDLSPDDKGTFSWLNCTRFKPPKLPRSKKRCNQVKRFGRGPRIPFSPHQISILEHTFANSQYLSSDNILSLANALQLTETRVKIWFQNRRARYRREKECHETSSSGFDETATSTKSSFDIGYHHKKPSNKCSKHTTSSYLNPLDLMKRSHDTVADDPHQHHHPEDKGESNTTVSHAGRKLQCKSTRSQRGCFMQAARKAFVGLNSRPTHNNFHSSDGDYGEPGLPPTALSGEIQQIQLYQHHRYHHHHHHPSPELIFDSKFYLECLRRNEAFPIDMPLSNINFTPYSSSSIIPTTSALTFPYK